MNGELLGLLRSDLSHSRTMTAKEAEDISLRLGVENPLAAIGSGQLHELEEWEIEVMISPMFTPNQEQRAAYESVLLAEGVHQNELEELMHALIAEKTTCPVVFGGETIEMQIPEVVMRRYIRLLHLDGQVGSRLVNLLKEVASACDYRAAISLARQPVWRPLKCRDLLGRCLEAMAFRKTFSINKLDFLTEFVRTHRPENLRDLIHNLDSLVESYQKDIYRPIYDVQLRDFQANAIRPRFCGAQVKAYRTSMAKSLLSDFRETS